MIDLWRMGLARCLLLIACLFAVGGASAPVRAQSFFEPAISSTYLIDIRQGTVQSERAANLGRGGYELSDGSWQSFDHWYKARWIEMRFDFMTQISHNFGILWGFSTGERGPKYAIDPGFKIGAIVQAEITPNFTVALLGTRMFGNRIHEKSCSADYGDLGVHEVNCRLAATTLSPADTLKYLVSDRSLDRYWVGLRVSFTW